MIFIILGSLAAALCTPYIALALNQHPTVPAPVQVESSASQVTPRVLVVPGAPVRLVIPEIGVSADIMNMGLTEAGAMDVPPNIVNVGWYKYGPDPGNSGSAVIAGHLDGLSGEPGVFVNLNKLQAGDKLSVIDDKGQAISFVVRKVQTYNQTAQPSEVFRSTSGSHLNLITCTGPWDNSKHLYTERLVVFTDRV